ncbi:hypothetical protein BJF90_16525 [Pseudonocardia sp. CNS-004]|nr:hypothetical protein BJF90_16525 [Pseudonocardia sp. CNS-004]
MQKARQWHKARTNRIAVARFAEFWTALQNVGDALAEAQKESKRADDPKWKARNQRHWELASVEEIRGACGRASSRCGSCPARRRRSRSS